MTKKEQEELLQMYKDQIEFFKNELYAAREKIAEYQKQNFDLQSALMSVRAPEAYNDMKRDSIQIPESQLSEEERIERQIMTEMLPKHLQMIEKPLFESAEDMQRALSPLIEPKKSKPIHNNEES